MATKQDIRNEGFRHGQSVASWVDMPEIGAKLPRHVDWVGHDVVTEANQYDVWEMLVRAQVCLLPDAFCDLVKPYDVDEVFRRGVEAGIQAYGRRHHKAELANAKEGN